MGKMEEGTEEERLLEGFRSDGRTYVVCTYVLTLDRRLREREGREDLPAVRGPKSEGMR